MARRQDTEALREALAELKVLRAREAAALRESNALLDGLERLTSAPDPGSGMRDLLAVMRRVFSCETAFVAALENGKAHITEATDPDLAGLELPQQFAMSGGARRIVDLPGTDWWNDVGARLAPRSRSLLSVPISLDEGHEGALVCLAEDKAHFTEKDQRLLQRMSALAAQALRALVMTERNALLAAVIDGASASVAIADATRRDVPLIYVNDAFLTLSGYAREDVLGRNCRFLAADAPEAEERRRLRETVAARGEGTFELLNRKKSGESFWNRLTIYPVPGADGLPRYLVATQVDITAERKAKEDRDEIWGQLLAALSSTSEGFLLLDSAGKIVLANHRYRDFFELEDAPMAMGAGFADFWARRRIRLGDDPATARKAGEERQRACFAGGRTREETLPDGRIVLLSEQSTSDGGAVSIATDITSVKATQRLLAQRAAAIDAAEDGIAITDTEGRFVYMNPSHLSMFGFTSEYEVLGRSWQMLYRADRAEFIERAGMPELRRKGTWRTEITGLRNDGSEILQEISLTLLPEMGLVCVSRDIAERRRDENERARLREQLAIAQRQESVAQVAIGVAHDFNNLLSVIGGSAALIGELQTADDRVQTYARRITKSAMHASQLSRRLLDLGAHRRDVREVDLRVVLEEAATLLRAGVSSGISVTLSLPDEPAVLVIDPTSVLQVVLNLGINARDAIGDSTGEISISLEDRPAGSMPDNFAVGTPSNEVAHLLVIVADTGKGMTNAEVDRIFEPYHTTKGAAGTGLGLALVASIATGEGGGVAVASRPGRGSTFSVYLPRAQSDKDATRARAEETRPATGDASLAGKLILVCEDVSEVGEVICSILERAGAETARCVDPRDALEAIEEDPDAWDLLVTDYDMGEMNGAELARDVRLVRPEMPILLCTALSEHDRGGPPFDAAIPKPIEPEKLRAAAHAAILSRQKAPDPREGP